jgi:hypothetical protein
VVGARQNQQRERQDHQKKSNSIQVARGRWQFAVKVLKHAAKLEANQDLRPENKHARLIERDLELLGNLHVILRPQEATDESRYRRWELASRCHPGSSRPVFQSKTISSPPGGQCCTFE